jgi:tetratricopeptide (TPR) repeat protein
MPAQSIRYAAAGIVLLTSTAVGQSQQQPSPAGYRDAVMTYMKTGDAEVAVRPLIGWDQKNLSEAVLATLDSADTNLIEAAALLHLEVGVALAGLSTASTAGHFGFGAQLIESIAPLKPDVRRNLSAARAGETLTLRSTWFGVAGSAFLSVGDIARARQFLSIALKALPRSPAALTLMGTADEIDGAVYNPEDIESPTLKIRASRERTRLLLSAQLLYERALAADPNYALAQIRLGHVQFLIGNLKQAGEWLQKGSAGAQDPQHKYAAAMFTGALQQQQKDLDGAYASFERALTIAPKSQSALVALAYVELLRGRPDHAQALSRSYTGTPNSDDGWWAYKNGTLDQAGLRWLRQRVVRK